MVENEKALNSGKENWGIRGNVEKKGKVLYESLEKRGA